MFYSQTFLARKGPLGTVWCAAHLQHRLKKSHYTSTDISSTVDCIMFPEVPIALRMSGHLLLGVVRIYSKKVDYLYQDCNVAIVALKKAFASTEVNLPENATTAKFEAVTLPQTFDLDEFDIDDDIDPNRFVDDHTSSIEDITIQDQVFTDGNAYVVVTFEDTMIDTLQPDGSENSNISPPNQIEVPAGNIPEDPSFIGQTEDRMDTNHPEESNRTEPINDNQDPGLSKEREDFNRAPNDEISPPEIMRDQPKIIENVLPFDDIPNDVPEQNQSFNRGLMEEKINAPFDDTTPHQKQPSLFIAHSESPNSIHVHGASGVNNSHALSGHTPEFNICSTPPVQPPKPRRRKRKNFFDETTVLTNKYMKKALENCSDILRKKRQIPCASLGIWKMSNTLRKEQVFSGPSLTGLCADICNLYEKDFISTKPHLILEREVTPEPRNMPSIENEPARESDAETSAANEEEETQVVREVTPEPMNTSVPEHDLEVPRNADGFDGYRIVYPPDLTPPLGINESTQPNSPKSVGSDTGFRTETSAGTSAQHTQGYSTATGTPFTNIDTGCHSLSDIPEIGNTAQTEDLSFLEVDNGTPGSQGTQGNNSLSVRTRAMAQFLLRQSPVASTPEGQPEDLSLNKILEGKTRKICARMFYETLILKTHGLIDVRQEQPYGDISLKLTPTLAKSQF